jgi:arylformamidase
MAIQANQPHPTPATAEDFRAETTRRSEMVRRTYRHELNVAYGDHPRQVLDIYYPAQAATTPPVLVFLHGGGFRQGSPGGVAYIGQAVLEQGGLFVAMGYRLVPEVLVPDMGEDVERGLRWLYEHLGACGADPERIFLSGHSAGATLAAPLGLRSGWLARYGLPDDLVKGLVLISGLYDDQYSRRPPETTNTRSPRYVASLPEAIDHLPPRTVVVATDNDLPGVLPDARGLVAAIQQRGGLVDLVLLEGPDHLHAGHSLADSNGATFQLARRMLGL